MTSAVAIQPAGPRPKLVPIAAARPRSKRPMSGKENVVTLKQHTSASPATNIRGRRERPCDACRRRKSRCVIHEGNTLCVLCEFHKQDCTFVESPQPRKRKLPADITKPSEGLKKRSGDQLPNTAFKTEPSITPPLAPQTEPQRPVTQPVLLQEALGLQPGRHSTYLGSSTPYDLILLALCKFDVHNESTTKLGILKRVTEHDYFVMTPDETTEDYSEDAVYLAEIRDIVGLHSQRLLDLYFRVVHPNFPIVHKRTVLEQVQDETRHREICPALLAGLYILALNWWSNGPPLPVSEAKPDLRRLEAVAFRALNKAMHQPKLSTVQAGLILLQRPDTDNWNLTTQLVAIGQELGLHINPRNWPVPEWEKSLRKRISWALYMQDKWSSLINGRPSHIIASNWAVKPIEPDDFEIDQPDGHIDERAEEELQDSIKGQELFSQMIILTSILAEVMDSFYTQRAIQEFIDAGNKSTRLILERAKPVQIRLKDWYAKLPANIKMDSPTNSRLSSIGYLHLAYYATEISLHRCIVQSLDPSFSDPYLLYICRSAAKTRLISAMDFVNRLKPDHLHGYWYFASRVNFSYIGTFGSLLWATAPAQEEADFYKTRLREYRWTLSVSRKRAAFLDYAVQMLDTKRAMLENLAQKPSALQTQAQAQANRMALQNMGHMEIESRRDDIKLDTVMEDTTSLSRYTSQSNFSVFSREMEQYGGEENYDMISASTPPSSD